MSFLYIGLSSISSALGVITIKLIHDDPIWLIPTILIYAILIYTYYMLFSYGNLGPLYTISKGLSVILVAILSWLLLGQRLSLRNIISIIIIIIGIALMNGYGS